MKKRRVWLGLIGVLFLGGALLAALFEPTHTFRGLLAGEPFFQGRSLSHWREVLRDYGQSRNIPKTTSERFWRADEAIPVLRACAHDSDRYVRWTAVALLGLSFLQTQPILDILIKALEDSDPEVRFQAIGALARWGPMARQAIPALTLRLQDPEIQVAHRADLVLWLIDPSAAAAARDWHPLTSSEFGFSVMLPGHPEEELSVILPGEEDKKAHPNLVGGIVVHKFQTCHEIGPHKGPTQYVVMVCEYPEGFLKGKTEEERFQAMKDSLPSFAAKQGKAVKLIEDKRFSLGQWSGSEHLLDYEGKARSRGRVYWVGGKLYGIMVVYMPEYLNEKAATYFLGSFAIEENAAGKAR